MALPLLALTQGDPAGIGPETLLGLASRWATEPRPAWRPLLVAEKSALTPLSGVLPGAPWDRLVYLSAPPAESGLPEGMIPVLDPVGERRALTFGDSGPADAHGALAALDAGVELVTSGTARALVTAPLAKGSIARHVLPGFTGHTEYLAERAGLTRYGRDYLMAFLAPDLQVALLSTHLPLRAALDAVTPEAIVDASTCLARHAGGRAVRIGVAGFNPHAGEGGLLGSEDDELVAPAVAEARARGLDATGPESADSLFSRARRGEFDWVLALYHDQGLIAVKTAAFGLATNWTLGLPYLRTSVDHGTAFALAGRGEADPEPLAHVIETTLKLLSGRLPRRSTPPCLS